MNRSSIATAVVLACGLQGAANAALITVEPDDFAEGTLLNNAVSGVTIQALQGTSSVYALPSLNSAGGDRVFGHDSLETVTSDVAWSAINGFFPDPGNYGLKATFDSLTNEVRIAAISMQSSTGATLTAYNSLDQVVASVDFHFASGNQRQELIVTRPEADIAYVIAKAGNNGQNIYLDTLIFNLVPEPASILLLAGGGLCLTRRRTA